MITNQEIVDTYLAYKHKKRTEGEKVDNTLPLMPFFIMDACYQIYCKDIKDLPVKQLMKKHKKKWAENYHKFTTDFFRAFNQDQVDYIIDMMDEFNDFIHNTIVMLKAEVVNYLKQNIPFEEKKVLGSLLACNVLAQAAQIMYGEMFRKGQIRYHCKALHSVVTVMPREKNNYIDSVKKANYDFACCFTSAKEIDLTDSDKVMAVVNILCKKIVKFLKDKENAAHNKAETN